MDSGIRLEPIWDERPRFVEVVRTLLWPPISVATLISSYIHEPALELTLVAFMAMLGAWESVRLVARGVVGACLGAVTLSLMWVLFLRQVFLGELPPGWIGIAYVSGLCSGAMFLIIATKVAVFTILEETRRSRDSRLRGGRSANPAS